MKCLLSLCLVTLTLAVAAPRWNAPAAQEMRQGVRVQMAESSNAKPEPQADYDPWLVTVTNNGELYFGIHPVTMEKLIEEMKSRPRDREQKLYIKADARTAYASVQKAIDAGRELSFETEVLLTSQADTGAPGTIVPPKGLEVLVGTADPSGKSAAIEVHRSKRRWPDVKIDNQAVPWSALQSTVGELLRTRQDKSVQLRADGQLPFDDIVHVIDACRSVDAKVFLAKPEI